MLDDVTCPYVYVSSKKSAFVKADKTFLQMGKLSACDFFIKILHQMLVLLKQVCVLQVPNSRPSVNRSFRFSWQICLHITG